MNADISATARALFASLALSTKRSPVGSFHLAEDRGFLVKLSILRSHAYFKIKYA